jgi:uncharacterized protein YecE (DUF72 family)
MEEMKKTKKIVPESSFNRGWSQIPPCFREEVCKRLMDAFGILTKSQFYARLRGEVEPKKSQISAIEEIFARYGITDIWGVESFNETKA